jgi:hypothetical protein
VAEERPSGFDQQPERANDRDGRKQEIAPKTKSINRRGTSYGLKHVAEYDIAYLSNGVFIAAATAEGFKVQRIADTPNAWIAISSKAWERSLRRGDGLWLDQRRQVLRDDTGAVRARSW